MAKNKLNSFAVYLALIFLAIPDFTIIDILPDFVAYIIFLSLIGEKRHIVPHLAEAYDGLKKMIFISVIKIPAMLFMLSNMLLGRDVIPLMTLTFSAVELVVLMPTLRHAFAGLYHVGERCEVSEILQPVRLGRLSIPCEKVEFSCYAFFITKLVLNTVSQLFLLSSSSEVVTLRLRKIYPIFTICSLLITLIFAIIILVIVCGYFKNIKKSDSVKERIFALMTPEQELTIKKNKEMSSLILPLNLFIIAQAFTLDFTLKNVGEYNLLPRFIFPILIFVVAYKLFDKKWQLINLMGSGAYAVACAIEYFISIDFYSRFSSVDLINDTAAQNAYRGVMTANIVELACAVPMLALFFIGIRKFIIERTGSTPDAKEYGALDYEMHKRFSVYFAIILGGDLVVFILKCVNALLKSSVSPLFTDAMDTLVAVSSAPWLSALISGVSIVIIFLSYYFTSQIKDEVKLKLNK